MAPWRKITGSKQCWEEHSSIRGSLFNWRQVPINTVILECGHEKVYRGHYAPTEKARCTACAKQPLAE